MNLKEKDFNDIDDYLDASMNTDEKQKFETELEINDELKQEYLRRAKLRKLWQDSHEFEETKAMIQSALASESKTSKIAPLWYYVSIAASVIILLTSYYFITQNQKNDGFHSLQIDQPASYAKLDSIQEIELISPKNHQTFPTDSTLVFNWKTSLNQLDTLRIYSSFNDSLFMTIPVQLSASKTAIHSADLGQGSYYWELTKSHNKAKFAIQ